MRPGCLREADTPAHVHHAWDVYISGGRTRNALLRGLQASLVQFTYTSLMGIQGGPFSSPLTI